METKISIIANGLHELSACHVGFIGFGMIAKETAKRLKAFKCNLSYYDIIRDADLEELLDITYLLADEILKQCDIISLHLPVTSATIGFISEEKLSLMKPTAFLINTARGKIIDPDALAKALINGKLAGAGVDTVDLQIMIEVQNAYIKKAIDKTIAFLCKGEVKILSIL